MLADRLKTLRKQLNMTQRELADELFVSPQLVSNWERGTSSISVENVLHMVEKFNLPLAFFMDGSATNDEPTDVIEQILDGFIAAIDQQPTQLPTFQDVASMTGISEAVIIRHFHSVDNLIYSLICNIDNMTQAQINEYRQQHGDDIFDVFRNCIIPTIYDNLQECRIFYTRPYLRGAWIFYLKSKYQQLLMGTSFANQPLYKQYIVDIMIALVSSWITAYPVTNPEKFQKDFDAIISLPMSQWANSSDNN